MRTYYYLPVKEELLENIEYFDKYYNCVMRRGIRCQYEDYPEHRYDTSKVIGYMVLIPISTFNKTNYLYRGKQKYDFKEIQLDSKDVFKWKDKYYIKEFEKRLNTTVWKEYSNFYKGLI